MIARGVLFVMFDPFHRSQYSFSQVISGWLLLVELALSRIYYVLPVMCVSCSLVITCWERAHLLAPLYVMFSCVLSPSHTVSFVMCNT